MRFFQTLSCTVLTLIVTTCFAYAVDHTTDTLGEIKKNIADGKAVLVDVREYAEWESGHCEKALSLPLSRLKNGLTTEVLKTLPTDKIVYTYCVSGRRSVLAGNILEMNGFQVRALKPGFQELFNAGFPMVKE